MPLPLIGLGLGIAGAVGQFFNRKRANKELDKLISQNPEYKTNPISEQRLALAGLLLNSRMPGAAQAERNIFTNQANILSSVNRNATDSSQALALAAGVQGQTNQNLNQLGLQESQDYYNRLQNLQGAQQGMIQEGDKVYQDRIRRFDDLSRIRGAQSENRNNMWGSVSNLGFGVMNFGLSGGFNGLLNNQQQQQIAGNAQFPQIGSGGYNNFFGNWQRPVLNKTTWP